MATVESDQEKPTPEDEKPILKDPVTGRFVKGTKGGGRQKGSRNKLGEAFIDALYADFESHGAAAIKKVRKQKPDAYLRAIASVVPKDLNVNVGVFDDMGEAELLQRIDEIDRAIRDFRLASDESEAGGGSASPTFEQPDTELPPV